MAFAAPYESPWNRCNVCGRFIAYHEFVDGTATHLLVNPDAYGSEEIWDTYHNRCEAQPVLSKDNG